MKIIISGASGQVGKLIIPHLIKLNFKLLLVGRDKNKLRLLYPTSEVCKKDEIKLYGKGYKTMIHLAVLNNNIKASYETFKEINVNLTMEYLSLARDIEIQNFINVSSTHALLSKNKDNYSRSKRELIEKLKDIKDINISNLYLPYIYGGEWKGKLSFLNHLPKNLSFMIFKFLSALKPSVKFFKIIEYIQSNDYKNETILCDDQSNNLFYVFSKKIIDLSFALTVLTLFWWLLLITWILVKIDSPGPGFFIQERVGKFKKKFNLIKFRTMKINTKETATHEAEESSITKIGRLLRKTKLDELPQIFNIFKNEMSLVGPRPCLFSQKELIDERDLNKIFTLMPGISGFAQINGIDMSNPKKLTYYEDKYKRLRSIIFDLKIILLTFLGKKPGR